MGLEALSTLYGHLDTDPTKGRRGVFYVEILLQTSPPSRPDHDAPSPLRPERTLTLPMTAHPVALRTMTTLRRVFDARSHSPDQKGWDAIGNLVETFTTMAQGNLPPKFHLCSLPPGFGKTTAITTFVSEMLRSPEFDQVGVLILVPRLDLLQDFVASLGAFEGGLHVLTADPKCNALSTAEANDARLLISTHSMMVSRSRYGSFNEAQDFFYQGKPRSWRCLDESIVPGLALSISTNDLAFLVTVAGRTNPGLSQAILNLIVEASKADDRATLTVPDFLDDHGVTANDVLGMLETWQTKGKSTTVSPAQEDQKAVVTSLFMLSGKVVTVRKDGKFGATILDYEEKVPADLAPIILLDASGDVRGTYKAWEDGRGNLVRLRNAPKNYSKLTIKVLERGGGKGSWSDKAKASELVDTIASEANRVFETNPKAKLLFVVHRPTSTNNYEADIRSLLKGGTDDQIRFTTWGRHDASNEFAAFDHVFLCGTLFYRPSYYEALGRAAAGLTSADGRLDDDLQNRVIDGEHKHLLLQAACRGSVRKSDGATCHPMNLFVIASRRSGITRGLSDVFPGCKLLEWKTKPVALKGKVGEAADWVKNWCDTHADFPGSFLRFTELQKGIGMKDKASFKRYIRRDERFIAFMYSLNLEEAFSSPKLQWPNGWAFLDVDSVFNDETLPPPETPEQIATRVAAGDY
jgi:hypothetical protein